MTSKLFDGIEGTSPTDDTCTSCGKPLGNAAGERCHDCGGPTYRGGSRIGPQDWQVLLGVAGGPSGD